MNKSMYKLLALLVLMLWTACSQETLLTVPDGGKETEDIDPNKRELVLSLQKELNIGSGASTRGIATDEENDITSLDIYLFASTSESGSYSFMKHYYYRSDAAMPKPANGEEVKLQMLAGSPAVTLRPEKGTYVKIYCVANQPELYTRSEIMGGDNGASGTGKHEYKVYNKFTPFAQSAPGSMENVITAGVPTEDDFKKLVTKVIDPADKNGYLKPSLVMSGADLTTVDLRDFSASSRLLRGIKLVRAVARFDVLNNPEKTKFTPESVAMLNGRPLSTLFPIEAQKGEGEGGLIQYPTAPVPSFQPVDKVYPVFYSYASTKDDKGELVLMGQYAINKTEAKAVSYKIPFMQKKENGDAVYVEINPNHRYTIEILEANEYELKFNFVVKEWDEGDKVDIYEPDNKIHLSLAAGNHANNFIQAEKNRLFMYIDTSKKEGSIVAEVSANSEYTIEDNVSYIEGSAMDWLTMETEDLTPKPEPEPEPGTDTETTTRADIPETSGKKFKITLTNKYKPSGTDNGKRPIAYVKIKNKATGEVTKFEVVVMPPAPSNSNNFKARMAADDLVIYTFISQQQAYPSNFLIAYSVTAPWRYPTMAEVDKLFGLDTPYTKLADLSTYFPMRRNADAFTTFIKNNNTQVTQNSYFPTSTTKDASNDWGFRINKDAKTIQRSALPKTGSNYLTPIIVCPYDEWQP